MMSYSIRIIALRALIASMPALAALDACLEQMISPVLGLPIWIVVAILIIIEILHIIEGGHMIGVDWKGLFLSIAFFLIFRFLLFPLLLAVGFPIWIALIWTIVQSFLAYCFLPWPLD